jgi:hypothetical protein
MREMNRLDEAILDLPLGTRVDILNPFVPSWSNGFVIHEVVDGGYAVRREIDDHVLRRVFAADEVRPVAEKPPSWW